MVIIIYKKLVCNCTCVCDLATHKYLAINKAKIFECPFQEDGGSHSILLWKVHSSFIS